MQKLDSKPILMDGAMGTELMKRGIKLDGASCKINLTHPEIVSQIHQDYIDAGSKILFTNTFGITVEDDPEPIITKAYEILSSPSFRRRPESRPLKMDSGLRRNEVNISFLIGGSVAGLFTGTQVEQKKAYQKQFELHVKHTPDFIVLETFLSTTQAQLALSTYYELNSTIPLMILFSEAQKGWLITVDEIKNLIKEFELTHVGFNCSNGPESVKEMFDALVGAKNFLPLRHIIVKPNTGAPPCAPTEFVEQMKYFIENGASYVGGCCGSGPEEIRQLSALI